MLDIGLLLYAGLLLLAIWRWAGAYWFFGMWLSIFNYMSLLYAFFAAALIYLLIGFYEEAQDPVALSLSGMAEVRDLWSIRWLKPFVLVAPIAVCVTLAMSWLLTESHLFEIHKRFAVLKHDRAVQIVALPAVFGVMALASMCPILELMTGRVTAEALASPWYDFRHPLSDQTREGARRFLEQLQLSAVEPGNFTSAGPSYEEAREHAVWRYETCFYLADLFEAWVVFQFGRLVLEQVQESFSCHEASGSARSEPAGRDFADEKAWPSTDITAAGDTEQTKTERDFSEAQNAVKSLTWVGSSVFIAVCVVQALCSIWPYIGGTRGDEEWVMFHMQVAGFVASCAAIYNLVVVEKAFRRQLEPISPTSKFLAMKVILSMTFIQRGFLSLLQVSDRALPRTMQRIVSWVPIIGDIMRFSDLQLHLFYPALVIYECLLLGIVHLFVWRSNERWYIDPSIRERAPLIAKAASSAEASDGEVDRRICRQS